jgi:hypothetical protein
MSHLKKTCSSTYNSTEFFMNICNVQNQEEATVLFEWLLIIREELMTVGPPGPKNKQGLML